MPKIIVRTTDAPEQLAKMEELLRAEGENVIRITEEEPLSAATQQDLADSFVWFISEQAEPADGLFNVVIANDEATVSGADLVVQADTFSPSYVIDEVKSRFDDGGDHPLAVLVDGYIMGTSDELKFVPGTTDHSPSDPDGVLQLWRDRIGKPANPGDAAEEQTSADPPQESDPTAEEDDGYAIPRINVGSGW